MPRAARSSRPGVTPARERPLGRRLDDRPVGDRVGEGDADLEHVGAAFDQGVEDRGAGLEIGIAEHDEGAERALAAPAEPLEHRRHSGSCAQPRAGAGPAPCPCRRGPDRLTTSSSSSFAVLGQLQRMGQRMGRFERADDPFGAGQQGEGGERLRVGRADIFGAAAVLEEGMLRARPRDNRARPRPTSCRRSARPRPEAHRSRRRAGCPGRPRSRVAPCSPPSRPLPGRLDSDQPDAVVVDEIGEQARSRSSRRRRRRCTASGSRPSSARIWARASLPITR